MNLQPSSSENKKYTVKARAASKSDTGKYNLTKKEVEESVIRSLDNAHKFLRGEIELGNTQDFMNWLDKLEKEVEEEENSNGRN